MEATVELRQLRTATETAAKVAEKSGAMPILAAVILEADREDGTLLVNAYNMEVGVRHRLSATGEIPGRVAVDAKRLRDLVKTIVGEQVQLVLDDRRLAILCGGTLRAHLAVLDDADMPPVPEEEPECVAIDGAVLSDALRRVAYAVSTDETRYNLGGAHVSIDDGRLVADATDGHRLARVTAQVPGVPAHELLIPRKAIDILARVAERESFAQLGATGGTVHVRDQSGEVEVFARMIDGSFPNTTQIVDSILSSEARAQVVVSTEALTEALKTIRTFLDDESGVHLTAGPTGLRLTSRDEGGDIEIDVGLLDAPSKVLTVGLNPKYLAEAIAATKSSQVELSIGSDVDPILVSPYGDENERPKHIGVVMPMRLSATASDSATATEEVAS